MWKILTMRTIWQLLECNSVETGPFYPTSPLQLRKWKPKCLVISPRECAPQESSACFRDELPLLILTGNCIGITVACQDGPLLEIKTTYLLCFSMLATLRHSHLELRRFICSCTSVSSSSDNFPVPMSWLPNCRTLPTRPWWDVKSIMYPWGGETLTAVINTSCTSLRFCFFFFPKRVAHLKYIPGKSILMFYSQKPDSVFNAIKENDSLRSPPIEADPDIRFSCRWLMKEDVLQETCEGAEGTGNTTGKQRRAGKDAVSRQASKQGSDTTQVVWSVSYSSALPRPKGRELGCHIAVGVAAQPPLATCKWCSQSQIGTSKAGCWHAKPYTFVCFHPQRNTKLPRKVRDCLTSKLHAWNQYEITVKEK